VQWDWLLYLVVGVIGFLAIMALLTWWLVRSAERRFPPVGKFVESGGIRLHYIEKGEGPPVVMLHGSNGSLHDYRLSIFDRASDEFRVMAFDRPGHGYSERHGPSSSVPSLHAELVCKAWKDLGMSRPILVAHSSAGAVAMDLATRHPEELGGVVLLSGVLYGWEGNPIPVIPLYRVMLKPWIGPFLLGTILVPLGRVLGRSLLKFIFAPDPVPQDYSRVGLAMAARPEPLRAEAEDLLCLSPSLQASYPDVRIPVVIMVGEEDHNVPKEEQSLRLKRELASSRLVLLPRTGHMPMFTKPDEVLDAIRSVVPPPYKE
jgi:pimeloyl-ACP methyl ester carboxylesterase